MSTQTRKKGDEDIDFEDQSIVARTHEQIRQMALSFELRPGERVNESELSRRLGVSRTPLREALNQLSAEGFLRFERGKGFFRKDFQPREMYELYQLRWVLEVGAARLAISKASEAVVSELRNLTYEIQKDPETPIMSNVLLDEQFHESLAAVSGNMEIVSSLRAVNLRIRPIRHFRLEQRHYDVGIEDHNKMLDAMALGDEQALVEAISRHASLRFDEIEDTVRSLYGRMYVA